MSSYASKIEFQEFGSVVEELLAKEVEPLSVVLYGKMGQGALRSPYKPMHISY